MISFVLSRKIFGVGTMKNAKCKIETKKAKPWLCFFVYSTAFRDSTIGILVICLRIKRLTRKAKTRVRAKAYR